MAYDNDPPEFIGSTREQLADPKKGVSNTLSAPAVVEEPVVEEPALAASPPIAAKQPPYRLNIFDAIGSVSKNIDEQEILKCNPEQLAVLFPLLDAYADSQAEDEACNAVEADKRKAETALGRAEKALAAVTPVWTAHDEWKKTVARLPVPEPDPIVVAKVASATKAVEATQAHLDACIAATFPAKARRDQKRAALTDLMRQWSKIDGAPKSVGDLIKERAAVEAAQKMANIAGGMPVDYVEHVASTVGNSHLDRFKAGQARGGSANFGYHRNSLRGAQLPMQKLPSQR